MSAAKFFYSLILLTLFAPAIRASEVDSSFANELAPFKSLPAERDPEMTYSVSTDMLFVMGTTQRCFTLSSVAAADNNEELDLEANNDPKAIETLSRRAAQSSSKIYIKAGDAKSLRAFVEIPAALLISPIGKKCTLRVRYEGPVVASAQPQKPLAYKALATGEEVKKTSKTASFVYRVDKIKIVGQGDQKEVMKLFQAVHAEHMYQLTINRDSLNGDPVSEEDEGIYKEMAKTTANAMKKDAQAFADAIKWDTEESEKTVMDLSRYHRDSRDIRDKDERLSTQAAQMWLERMLTFERRNDELTVHQQGTFGRWKLVLNAGWMKP